MTQICSERFCVGKKQDTWINKWQRQVRLSLITHLSSTVKKVMLVWFDSKIKSYIFVMCFMSSSASQKLSLCWSLEAPYDCCWNTATFRLFQPWGLKMCKDVCAHVTFENTFKKNNKTLIKKGSKTFAPSSNPTTSILPTSQKAENVQGW